MAVAVGEFDATPDPDRVVSPAPVINKGLPANSELTAGYLPQGVIIIIIYNSLTAVGEVHIPAGGDGGGGGKILVVIYGV